MALVRDVVVDLIQILPDRQIQVRQIRRVVDTDTGDVVATGAYHRFVLDPGVHEITDVRVMFAPDLANAINSLWTPEVIAARKKFVTEQEAVRIGKLEAAVGHEVSGRGRGAGEV